ncbi:MAG TPA: hypothetical protein PL070_21410 [Flavobacteriales bacterium]|nr:hypothetical protein [Flavobacteriales bacterium]
MEVFDFLSDQDDDLYIEDGDLAFGESTLQHQRDLLLIQPGELRQFPLIGAGIHRELLNSAGPDELRVVIQREMERDGMVVDRLSITRDYDVELVAHYG